MSSYLVCPGFTLYCSERNHWIFEKRTELQYHTRPQASVSFRVSYVGHAGNEGHTLKGFINLSVSLQLVSRNDWVIHAVRKVCVK